MGSETFTNTIGSRGFQLQRGCNRRRMSEDYVWLGGDQLFRKWLILTLRWRPKASFDLNIAALGPSALFEPLPKRRKTRLGFRVVFGVAYQHADASHTVCLLRSGGKGDTIDAPPRSVMNSRRCIASLARWKEHGAGSNYHAGSVSGNRCPLWVISGHLQCKRACPLYPRKRTCAVQLGMSALCQKRTLRKLETIAFGPTLWCVSGLPASLASGPKKHPLNIARPASAFSQIQAWSRGRIDYSRREDCECPVDVGHPKAQLRSACAFGIAIDHVRGSAHNPTTVSPITTTAPNG